MTKKIFLILVFFCSSFSQAETFTEVLAANRSFPNGYSVEAAYFYNDKLWDKSDADNAWKYGFWRTGFFAAAHGYVGARLDVFPISILQLTYLESMTSRFYDTATIDCLSFECRSTIHRRTLKTAMALGYGDFYFVPSYSKTELTNTSVLRKFSSEEDNLIADQNGDESQVVQFALGYKWKTYKASVLSKWTKLQTTGDSNVSHYFVWSGNFDKELKYFFGAGSFKSTYSESQFSVLAGLRWTSGKDLSFF